MIYFDFLAGNRPKGKLDSTKRFPRNKKLKIRKLFLQPFQILTFLIKQVFIFFLKRPNSDVCKFFPVSEASF